MDRIEVAKDYVKRCMELGSFDMKKMNPHNDGMHFVISYLYRHKEETTYAGDIAKALGVSTARIAAALNNLEEKKWIVRTTAETDSRKTKVSLTEEGCKVMEDKGKNMIQCTADLIDLVGIDDMNEFLRISKKIKEAMKTIDEKGKNDV